MIRGQLFEAKFEGILTSPQILNLPLFDELANIVHVMLLPPSYSSHSVIYVRNATNCLLRSEWMLSGISL